MHANENTGANNHSDQTYDQGDRIGEFRIGVMLTLPLWPISSQIMASRHPVCWGSSNRVESWVWSRVSLDWDEARIAVNQTEHNDGDEYERSGMKACHWQFHVLMLNFIYVVTNPKLNQRNNSK